MAVKKHNIFQQFFLSLFSFKDYAHFAHAHGGKVFLYAVILSCITYVVTFIIPTMEVLPYIYQLNSSVVDDYVPYFEISNGEFYIEEELYYEDGPFMFYATSDYAISQEEAEDILSAYLQGFIVSTNAITIKQSNQIDTYDFSLVSDLSREDLYDFIPMIRGMIIAVYILMFFFYIAVYFFGSMVCALIGQLINLGIKAPVSFGGIFKATAYARTAPILIKMLFVLFTPFNLNFAFFYALFAVYMIFALRAIKKAAEPPMPMPLEETNQLPEDRSNSFN